MDKFDEYVQICKATADARYAGLQSQFGPRSNSPATDALDAYRDCVVSGTGIYALNPADLASYGAITAIRDDRFTRAEIDDARTAATAAERARIFAALEECRPTTQAYSRREWAYEEKGRRELFSKIAAKLGMPVKEGE
jgi:hypothetical protein